MERITTTHAELRESVASVIATADGYNPNADPALWELDRDRYLALADVAIERVVEGLVATIKALPTYDDIGEAVGGEDADYGAGLLLDRDAVLAVVEAAREDTA